METCRPFLLRGFCYVHAMEQQPIIPGGIYRHYKGKDYRVFGLVVHSETLEELVHYECLYDNPNGQYWVRPRALFQGSLTVDGVTRPRFAFTGEIRPLAHP